MHPSSILIVDDDPEVLEVVARILKKDGYDIQIAADGQEALDLFKKHVDTITLVLTDLAMPRKNGIELIRDLRVMKPAVGVIVMSADLQCWQEELVGVTTVSKPFAIHTLLKEVENKLTS